MLNARKTTPADIISWLIDCESQVAADGYQQSECSQQMWYINGPPEIFNASGNQMMVRDANGDEFLVKITRIRKPATQGG